MKRVFLIFFVLFAVFCQGKAEQVVSADFRWGNGFYFNLNMGETIVFNEVEVTLLKIENHYNQLRVGEDTICLKVARQSLPVVMNGIRIFVADNKKVKALASNPTVHGLLTKDALVCLSDFRFPLLDPLDYSFPVSFNDGFTWSAEEESHIFSFYPAVTVQKPQGYYSYPGFGIDLHDARGLSKHWLTAFESSRVVWVQIAQDGASGSTASLLLQSDSQPDIYYAYSGLFPKNIVVKKGQKLAAGDLVGTAWGDSEWGHLHFAVIYSSHEPAIGEIFNNIVNGFPQLVALYFRDNEVSARYFSRGRVIFGFPRHISRNRLNVQAYETHTGKGWLLGKWNPADKVEWVTNGREGNARLSKVLFRGTPAQFENPEPFYEFRITVTNGSYRIRAKVGDLFMPSWQKIEFNGIEAATKVLEAGETDWTGERIVKVKDGRLVVRIYTDKENKRVAGLGEIVFQRAF